jgi:hypothetical protein
MSTTDNAEPAYGFGSLKKLVARALIAGGFGLAVMGLGAGIANADPLPTDGVSNQPGVASTPVPPPPTDGVSNQPGVASTPVTQPNPGDLSDAEQQQLQRTMEQRDQLESVVSNTMKSSSATEGAIIQNLKP